ncbi:uncharacterized protein LOC109405522 [Aedes albopictus]|uniref:CCHC-type domain-containing protein n=1 Tax=Aedes albopictus TaxID=7160 RepID=A0ABM1XNA4_AEDAL
MDLTHWSNEEIDYELALRFVVNLGPSTHRNKVLKLKELMSQEDETSIHNSEHVMSSSTNLETCQNKIGELRKLVDEAILIKDTFVISQLRSRLLHYDARLKIIQPLVPFVSTKETLCALVKVLLSEVNSALLRIGKRNDRSDSAVTNLTPFEGTMEEREDVQRHLASKQTDAASMEGAYSIQEFTNSGQHQKDNTRVSTAQNTSTGAVHKEQLSSVSCTEGFPPMAMENNFQRANSMFEDHEPQLSATSSPVVSGRGRGLVLRDQHDRRDNTRGRGRATNTSAINDSLNRKDQIHDQTFRNIITNNASLYADLVERLARREQPVRTQTNERPEDRRMMKAVHNWPFKFRGEKDTTSLNIFLDRVETFAKSEGMSDATLLSSIKHLLQDDALDWYARAMTQQSLHSWQAFKKEIRKEFLPVGYAQILRLEASFRFQGQQESFAKYYRDIAALFRFISPPMAEEEKFFIVKKNMNADYAAIVTAARPMNLQEMVEVCTSYDETRMLLNRQRRVPVPHNSLLEPNFATPVSPAKPYQQSQPPRYSRVNAVESIEGSENSSTDQHSTSTFEEDEAEWQSKIDQLMQQVSALKGQFERKPLKQSNSQAQNLGRSLGAQPVTLSHHSRTPSNQYQQRWQLEQQQQEDWQQDRTRAQPASTPASSSSQYRQEAQHQQPWHQTQQHPVWQQRPHANPSPALQLQTRQQPGSSEARPAMTCWNCDEEGHRFMDCPKPQAILFCYRCGRKGYSLRSCFTCRTDAGNQQAGNLQ